MSDESNAPDDNQRTVFTPGAERAAAPERPAGEAAPATVWSPAATAFDPAAATAFAPQGQVAPPAPGAAGRLPAGSILNHIYEVKRFIARGGMGEVYEGVNVNTDERVAIKVMLPQLAADPNVQAMFRKEARTLTRLHHPAVVNYRVLAQEPHLGVFYIVTEFIDGAALSDLLDTLKPTPEQLRRLTRRLAEGLGAAHELGAIHRDISPDNVLLPERRLELAKIIDFGIAKDMDTSKGTIVGDGFAGKLGYVAPEQFGDFDRQIGPWTDVYSLGLVILAAAQGRDVEMGATLVEAVDRRRAGPDLDAAPPELRPVLARMLVANPAHRLRSMTEVIAALDGDAVGPAASGAAASSPATAFVPDPAPPPSAPARKASGGRAVLLGGAAVALIAAGGAAVLLLNRPHPSPAATGAAGGAAAVRQSVEASLPTIGCSWLNLADLSTSPAGAALRLSGVAGRPAAAQQSIATAVSRAGASVADLDLDEVAPVGEALCPPLDVFRPLRSAVAGGLAVPQRKFEIVRQADDGKLEARAVINMTLREPVQDLALVGLEPSGKLTLLIKSRADLDRAIKAKVVTDVGGGAYRLLVNTDHTGWSGMLLITGKGPFDPALIEGDAASRGADWPESFRNAAAQGGWTTDMVWYRTVRSGG